MDKQYEINLVIYILGVVSKGKINRRVEAEVRKCDLEGFLMSDAIWPCTKDDVFRRTRWWQLNQPMKNGLSSTSNLAQYVTGVESRSCYRASGELMRPFCMCGWACGWACGWVDLWVGGLVDGLVGGCVGGHVGGWACEWVGLWVGQRERFRSLKAIDFL